MLRALRRLFCRDVASRARKGRPPAALAVEALEDRCLLNATLPCRPDVSGASLRGDGAGAPAPLLLGGVDITQEFGIHLGKVRRKGRDWVQTVTLTNNSGTTVSGPPSLTLKGLPARVRLLSADGVRVDPRPNGPVVGLDPVVAPGATLTLLLRFRAPCGFPRSRLRYQPQVRGFTRGLAYHGGPVLSHVGVEVVFYGQSWATDPALCNEQKQIDDYFRYLTGSSFMDLLAQYGTPTQAIGRGRFVGSTVIPDALAAKVDDSQIQQMLGGAVARGDVPAPDANRVTFVFVAPGVVVTADGEDSVFDFFGYHSAFGPGPAQDYYAVLPYQAGPNGHLPRLSEFQSLTDVCSHELAEAVTDPNARNGWYLDSIFGGGPEIADLASRQPAVYLNGYAVTQLWSNQVDGVVAPAGAAAAPTAGRQRPRRRPTDRCGCRRSGRRSGSGGCRSRTHGSCYADRQGGRG
jgi:hypothetical protein